MTANARTGMALWHLAANLARAVLPAGLIKWLRGDFKSVHGRVFNRWERTKLQIHQLRGGRYIDWYARRMDGFAAHPNVDPGLKRSYHDSGIEDLETVKQLGLKPTDRLHEFGCGFLRSARYFIDYLDSGHYSGNDTSGERMTSGAAYIKATYGFDIMAKSPKLIVNTDNSFDWLDVKPDMIWCYAVFTHMPEEDIEDVFRNLHKVMKPDTGFYFTYSEKRGQRRVLERMGAQDWWHKQEFFDRLADRHSLAIEHEIGFLDVQRSVEPDDYRTHFSKLSLG